MTSADSWSSAALALALVLVVVSPAWRFSRHVVTIAHEGAHGVAALLTGRRLSGIRLHSDASGLTVSRGRTTGFGMVVTAFAGYVGPAFIGLGAAYLLRQGRPVAVLWAVLVLLALLLLQIRNFYGLYVVLLAAAGIFAVSWWGSDRLQSFTAYAGTWYLLLAAPRGVVDLQRARRQRRARDSDADTLARLTRLPAFLWVIVFFVVTLACLFVGGRWLWAAA